MASIDLPAWAEPLWRPCRYKILYGGRGAGRSWTVARVLLLDAASRPLRILCARELQRSIADSVHRLLTDQIEMMGLPGYEITQTEIRHRIGSSFIFTGLRHNATKIKSIEGLDRCWVEEAETVSEDSWAILVPSVRKAGSEIWITLNPDQETDATYRRFVANPPPDALKIKVSSHDNPWLTDELRIEREYAYSVDPAAAAWVWGGECRRATKAQVLAGKWVVDDFEPAPDWGGPYHGVDFGFAQSPTTCLRLWTHERALYVEREAYSITLELDKTAEYFQVHLPGVERYVLRADSARPESISYLKRHGLPRIEAAPKWQGSVADGIAHLRSYERIVIHPRCRHSIEEANLYSYKVAPNGDILPDVVDAHNHCIDAWRYALAPLIRGRKRVEVLLA